jgi:serine/threonine-protein kinase HipA
MTISDHPGEAYVWVWLPGAVEPVVAGRLQREGDIFSFVYGASYLARSDAISLYTPELPLRQGRIVPLPELTAPGCIVDGRPDSWGQRVIMNRLMGVAARDADPAELGLLTYLLESASDRIGALDFQGSSEVYAPRESERASLDQLLEAAELLDSGQRLPEPLERALLGGSSVGGARPKALIEDDKRQLIAKFPSVTDLWPVVQYEFVAMTLAARAGLDVAPVDLRSVLGRPVLLIDRFDRAPGEATRRSVVSALTILELDELAARWASYFDLAQALRETGDQPELMLRELFSRITFNILVGNTDDHARNQAAFWDGQNLRLTPAYDISPMLRTGGEASQAMIIGDESDRFRLSEVAGCVQRAHLYQLTEAEAREIVDRQRDVIDHQFDEVCDLAALAEEPRTQLRQVMPHRFAIEGYDRSSQSAASTS